MNETKQVLLQNNQVIRWKISQKGERVLNLLNKEDRHLSKIPCEPGFGLINVTEVSESLNCY